MPPTGPGGATVKVTVYIDQLGRRLVQLEGHAAWRADIDGVLNGALWHTWQVVQMRTCERSSTTLSWWRNQGRCSLGIALPHGTSYR